MRKINWKPIGDFACNTGKIALYGLVTAAVLKARASNTVDDDESASYDYSDAIEAIMDSCMLSSDKRRAIEILDRYESAEYYRSVIKVIENSSTLTNDKLKMIEYLSES